MITIVLGGKQFQLRQLAVKADGLWRNSIRDMMEPIGELMITTGVNAPTPERLARLAMTSAMFIDPLKLLDALFSYSSDLQAEQTWIEENAVTEEVLIAVCGLFFGVGPMVNGAAQKPAATT